MFDIDYNVQHTLGIQTNLGTIVYKFGGDPTPDYAPADGGYNRTG